MKKELQDEIENYISKKDSSILHNLSTNKEIYTDLIDNYDKEEVDDILANNR